MCHDQIVFMFSLLERVCVFATSLQRSLLLINTIYPASSSIFTAGGVTMMMRCELHKIKPAKKRRDVEQWKMMIAIRVKCLQRSVNVNRVDGTSLFVRSAHSISAVFCLNSAAAAFNVRAERTTSSKKIYTFHFCSVVCDAFKRDL